MDSVSQHHVDEIPQSNLEDSGLRHVFASGAMRERAPNKGRFDLLSPLAQAELAKHFENGAIKYVIRGWEKGLPLSSFVDSALRHINQFLLGDESEPHDVAALWNLHCLVHTRLMIELGKLPTELNDLPEYLKDNKLDDQTECSSPEDMRVETVNLSTPLHNSFTTTK